MPCHYHSTKLPTTQDWKKTIKDGKPSDKGRYCILREHSRECVHLKSAVKRVHQFNCTVMCCIYMEQKIWQHGMEKSSCTDKHHRRICLLIITLTLPLSIPQQARQAVYHLNVKRLTYTATYCVFTCIGWITFIACPHCDTEQQKC